MPNSNQASGNNGLSGEFVINRGAKKSSIKPDTSTEIKNPKDEIAAYNLPVEDISQRIGPFTALSYNPDGVVFKDLEQGEKIILLVRRHFATNILWILELIAIALVPIIFVPLLPAFFPFINISLASEIAFLALYYLAVFAFLLINFTDWYFNVSLVTNQRVIDLDISGILTREVAETKLELIADVSYDQIGTIASFFNYGNILIQTAAEQQRFEFNQAPQPAKILHILGDLIGKPK